ncbi:DUF1737 domain-containing protein [Klebsiella pneumoniae]|nr:DUF1737 domain-containing protein [Klebsiella pneumoniae]KRR40282.1 hypothetical protein AFK73_06965 [Klebsiella pneumoniae]MBB2647292.1 hypothetical protein [Klebsiella pneumoniae]MBD0035125.1 DUF1737 domain-containing protein [Klebsiella pneumoniae]OVK41103.1 hypothetical protein B8053_09280 [Klebsiella pneumoniae]
MEEEHYHEQPRNKNKGHKPPDGLPRYRLLTGKDDAKFCHRVSEALALGYQLYGSPAATFNGQDVIVAQAIIWPEVQQNQAS